MDLNLIIQQNALTDTAKIEYEKYLIDKLQALGNYLNGHHKKHPKIIVNVGKPKDEWSVSYMLDISRPVYVHTRGQDLYKISDQLYKIFKKRIINQRKAERKDSLLKRKFRQKSQVNELLPDLSKHKEEEDREAFNHLFQSTIKHIRNYLGRRLKEETARNGSSFPIPDEEELLAELYLEIWSNFDHRPDNKEHVNEWIFSIADQFLVKNLKPSERNTISIEELAKLEGDTLEEKITIDAEGELYLEEDLVDTNDQSVNYRYQDLFPDEIIFDQYKIEDYNRFVESFDNQVCEVLSAIPIERRTTFDLYFIEGMSVTEISRIKKTNEKEIKRSINEVYNYLIRELKKWMDENYKNLI